MISLFENLSGPGKPLKAEPPDEREFAGLVRSGHARLKDALNTSLLLVSRFDLAYNAAHALCLAALRWNGYRSTNRYIVFQLLPSTLGLGPEVWRVLSKCHDIRNRGVRGRIERRRANRQRSHHRLPSCRSSGQRLEGDREVISRDRQDRHRR